MLLESEVEIRCKESDAKLVEAVLADAAAQYSKIIQTETKATKTCKLSLNKKEFLPASTIGGVVLACQSGKITIDNTIDLRLKLVMEQDKPAIRSLLFPYSLLVVIALRQRMNSGGNFLLILVQ